MRMTQWIKHSICDTEYVVLIKTTFLLKVKYANSDYERGKIKHRDCFDLKIDGTIDYDKPGKGHYLPY